MKLYLVTRNAGKDYVAAPSLERALVVWNNRMRAAWQEEEGRSMPCYVEPDSIELISVRIWIDRGAL